MDSRNMMICWNANGGEVALIQHPDKKGDSDQYFFSALACNSDFKKLDFEERKKIIFIEAMHMIVRDKVDAMKLHSVLLALDEYRDGCAEDMPGMIS